MDILLEDTIKSTKIELQTVESYIIPEDLLFIFMIDLYKNICEI